MKYIQIIVEMRELFFVLFAPVSVMKSIHGLMLLYILYVIYIYFMLLIYNQTTLTLCN